MFRRIVALKGAVSQRSLCLSLILASGIFALAAQAAVLEDGRVVARDESGNPTFWSGELGSLEAGLEPDVASVAFLAGFATENLDAIGDEELTIHQVTYDDLGYVHTRLKQTLHGLPLVGSQLIVHADAATGQVYSISGRFVTSEGLPVHPDLKPQAALAIATGELAVRADPQGEPVLVYVLGADGQPRLAWQQRIEYEGPDGRESDDFFADAFTGELVARHPTIHRAKSWKTHTANNGFGLPGALSCTNTQSCGDSVLQNIHNGSSVIYDYYKAKFGRNSYNGTDITITSTGHYRSGYVNAFWDGSFLVYGDGNGSQSGPLGNAFDIVAHEFTHAVTEFESGLIYQGESGALNEAWSDIFAASAEAWQDGGISADTWKLGEDTWTPGVGGDALRYMNNPTQDGVSRDYYPERYTGSQDNGGVHWNSGIANLAYYLMSQGGQHPRGKTTVTVPAIGMGRAEQIFYRAQTTYLTPSSNFAAARNATGQAALDLYGATYRDHVYTGWCAVGVGSCPTAASDDAQFITQSVPTSLAPGQTATVSVTLKNVGTTTWTRGAGYKLGSQNPQDNLTWGLGRVLLPTGVSVSPGQSYTFNFSITAPPTPGTYNFQWRMVKEGVAWFGAYTSNRQIAVTGGGVDNSQYVSQSVPSSMVAGATATVSVTMKNTGTTTWTRTAGYKLGSQNPQDNTTWGLHRVWLPSGVSVAPGQSRTFTFTIRAPSMPGTYNFRWRMVHEGVAWFGAFSPNQAITVTASTNNAAFVSQSVPTVLNRNQIFTVSVTMQNTGTTTWTRAAGHKLGSENPRDNYRWGLNRVWLPSGVSVAPGQSRTFTFNIRAPSTPGVYNFQWRMVQDGVQWFGAFSPNRQIQVN